MLNGASVASARASAHSPSQVADPTQRTHRIVLFLVGALTASVLVLTARGQLYDSNFLFLSEVPSILAGDHPYRDFFEWGAPLPTYLSTAAQLLVGYRLIGEFALQWLFIAAGTVIACDLGLRLSRSIATTLATMIVAALVIAVCPTYHYPKLFFFPLLVWLGWRYMDAPGVGLSAAFGLTTAIAFLFRHDFVAYFALAYVLASTLARVINPAARSIRSIVLEAAVAGAVATLVVSPWALVVERNEGFVEYTKARATKYEQTHGVFRALLQLNPIRELGPAPAPAPQPGVVGFFWQPQVDETRQHQIEQRLGMRLLDERDRRGRLQYAVPNVFDPRLLELDPYINDGDKFQWERMQEQLQPFPARETVALWLEQMALLVPIGLGASAAWQMGRSLRRSEKVPIAAWRMLFSGVVLAAIDATLLREPSYVALVAPLAAALSAPLASGVPRSAGAATIAPGAVARIATMSLRACAWSLLLLTIYAAAVWAKNMPFFHPSTLVASTQTSIRALFNSPPVEGAPGFSYVHDCTAPGDRLLVTGSTPFHVNYYAERPMAGGHLYWHSGWRSDPVHEQESLALLQRQSVPFAISTHDPVLVDFVKYPRIREYLMKNYAPVEGTSGKILVDTRREPTGRFGELGLPCFRNP
jgi:hypothetical protein